MKTTELAVKLGMTIENEVPAKVINGFKVQLVEMTIGRIKQTALAFITNSELDKPMQAKIRKANGISGLYIQNVGLANNAVYLPIKKNISAEKFDEKVEKVTKVLSDLGVKDLDYCPFCGSSEELDGVRTIEGANIHVHEVCVDKFLEEAEKSLQAHDSGSYSKGIMGAVFGAALGAIPAAIALFLFSYLIGLLFALIPFASFYFYRKSGAPKTTQAVTVIGVLSLALAALMGFGYYSMVDAWIQSGEIILEAGETFTLTPILLQTVLFAAIGVWVAWNYMYKNTSGAMRKNLSQYKK